MQISLKELLAIIAICGGFLWTASEVGFDSGIFQFVASVSATMSGLFLAAAYFKFSRRFAWIIPIVFLGFGAVVLLGFISFALFVNALLLLLFGIYCAVKPATGKKTKIYGTAACALIGLIAGVVPGMIERHHLEELRQQYPIVSLEGRMKFEQTHRNAAFNPEQLAADVSAHLVSFEQTPHRYEFYTDGFKQIHQHEAEVFIRSTGFGIGRFSYYATPHPTKRADLRNITFDEKPSDNQKIYDSGWEAAFDAKKLDAAEQAYEFSRLDFLDPVSFGGSLEPLKKVVGFVPHALHYSPTSGFDHPNLWSLDRLELVSLLKFDTPRVYVLDHLPRMDQLSSDNVPTRELDEFETAALEKLWTQEDVVVEHEGAAYRMLGSLRAANQCLNCHNVQRGELLGAFSYRLRRNSTD